MKLCVIYFTFTATAVLAAPVQLFFATAINNCSHHYIIYHLTLLVIVFIICNCFSVIQFLKVIEHIYYMSINSSSIRNRALFMKCRAVCLV